MKLMVFYHPRKSGREMKPKKERHTYLRFAPASAIWWNYEGDEVRLLVLSFYIYTMEGRQSSLVMSQRLCIALLYIQGGKSIVLEKWRPSIWRCSRWGRSHSNDFKRFHHLSWRLNSEIWAPKPPPSEIKTLWQGSSSVDGIYYNSKPRLHRTDLGDTCVLIEYWKPELTLHCFKSIYQLLVNAWDFKGMVQVGPEIGIGKYRQEQMESKLLGTFSCDAQNS